MAIVTSIAKYSDLRQSPAKLCNAESLNLLPLLLDVLLYSSSIYSILVAESLPQLSWLFRMCLKLMMQAKSIKLLPKNWKIRIRWCTFQHLLLVIKEMMFWKHRVSPLRKTSPNIKSKKNNWSTSRFSISTHMSKATNTQCRHQRTLKCKTNPICSQIKIFTKWAHRAT